jgi:hypothetical protein
MQGLRPLTAPFMALLRNPLLRNQLGCLASRALDQILWPALHGLDSENLKVTADEILLRDPLGKSLLTTTYKGKEHYGLKLTCIS